MLRSNMPTILGGLAAVAVGIVGGLTLVGAMPGKTARSLQVSIAAPSTRQEAPLATVPTIAPKPDQPTRTVEAEPSKSPAPTPAAARPSKKAAKPAVATRVQPRARSARRHHDDDDGDDSC
jgi:hypothetical protein